MPRPSTVTALLALVEQQSRTIETLSQALASVIPPPQDFVGAPMISVSEMAAAHDSLGDTLPERVRKAISMVPGLTPDFEDYLVSTANELLDAGMDEHLVVQRIAHGEQ